MKRLVAATLAAIPLAVAWAAPTVKLSKPPPGRWTIEDLWKATVISDSTYDNVWFEGFVFEAQKGQVFWAKTKTFSLSRGLRVYRYKDVTVEETETAEGYEAFVTRTGGLPAGVYDFRLLLMPFGIGDSFRFEVLPTGPPRLVTPRQGDTVKVKYPVFVWTPPAPGPPGLVTYELKLCEVLTGQTPEAAMSANPAWLVQTGLRTTSLPYPTGGRPLPDRGEFAWQVSATAPDSTRTTSEVRSFVLSDGARMLTREQVIAIILKQVIKPESLDHDVVAFLGRAPLGPDDTLAEADDSRWQKTFSGLTWFGWVNDRPLAYFAHPTRYVFVDAYTGALSVEVRNWWPSLNRNWIWVTPEELAGDRYVIFLETKGGGR